MRATQRRLILFTRYPVPGRAKTRLIPSLGEEGAAALQREMTAHTVLVARSLAAYGIGVEVRFDGASARALRRWLGGGILFQGQGGGDLGQRLRRAFQRAFARGDERVVVIGSDCPSLDAKMLDEAFAGLEAADVVLGPASDGGYYLIGLRKPAPALFEGIDWGTHEVFTQTMERAARLSLRYSRLPELSDVDRPEDLPIWEQARRRASTLTVIIPTLNEAKHLATTLEAVATGKPDEIVVADGGSTDRTREVARGLGARVIQAPRGRARQMNAGAATASSGLLLFLHADTLPPRDFKDMVVRTLQRPEVTAGAFAFAIREPIRHRWFVERLVGVRCRLFKNPFGDQGLFLRRDLFESIGGFPEWPILEDVEIVRRLKAQGRLAIERTPALTSGRRWLTHGVWKTLWINQRILLGFHRGIPTERLARIYRSPGRLGFRSAARERLDCPRDGGTGSAPLTSGDTEPRAPLPQGRSGRARDSECWAESVATGGPLDNPVAMQNRVDESRRV